MDKITLLPISSQELRKVLREELNACLSKVPAAINNNSELLNIKGASGYLNLSVASIYNLVHQRKIPYMKRSRRLYFSKQELRQWVEEGRKPTVTDLSVAATAHLAERHQLKKRT